MVLDKKDKQIVSITVDPHIPGQKAMRLELFKVPLYDGVEEELEFIKEGVINYLFSLKLIAPANHQATQRIEPDTNIPSRDEHITIPPITHEFVSRDGNIATVRRPDGTTYELDLDE
jgi:hypothetical protein